MKAILKSIQDQTLEFKTEFLKKYNERIVSEFNTILTKYTWNNAADEVADEHGIERRRIYSNRSLHLKVMMIQDIHRDNHNNRLQARIDKELSLADKAFETKQMRLADRLSKHMNDDTNFKVTVNSSYPNLNGFVEVDNIKVISFYTIVAEGSVQRPHFRYLFK